MFVKTVKGIRLATTSGVIRMAPGTQRNLEGEYLQQALAKGAYPVDPEKEPPVISGAKFRLDGDDPEMTEDERAACDPEIPRSDRVIAAVRALVERGDPACLTSAGVPRVRDVAAMIGDEVSRDEIDLALKKVS